MKYLALLFALTAFTSTAQATELIVLPTMVISSASVESCRDCKREPAPTAAVTNPSWFATSLCQADQFLEEFGVASAPMANTFSVSCPVEGPASEHIMKTKHDTARSIMSNVR